MAKVFGYLWYNGWWWISFTLMILGFSFRFEGRRRVPLRGGVLIIANHQSFFDPIVLGLACPRPLRYLARKTLFRPAWFSWLITSFGAVPVDQEGVAKEGLKTVLHQLQAGQAVVVFPEGTRTPNGALSPVKPGVQLLIKRTQVPIVPVGIAGAFEALPYWRHIPTLCPLFLPATGAAVAVAIGEPLDPVHFASLPREQLVAELTVALQKVKDRAEKIRRKI